MSTTTRSTPKYDLSLGHRGVVSSVTQGSLALAAIAAAGGAAHIPAYGGGVMLIGALCHLIKGARRAWSSEAILYRLGCWAGAGGWLSYTLYGNHVIWSKPSLISLAVGAGAAGMLSEFAYTDSSEKKPSGALVLRSAARASNEWEDRFRRVCKAAVRVPNIRDWDNGFGYDVFGEIPANSGMTLKQIAGRSDALATDADLPDGCGIEFERAGSRAKFVAHVSTENRLVATIDYPEDYSPRSIYDDMPIGEYRNSDPALINLRENSGVVVGQKRSGKTNTLDVITAGVGRCADALVLHIDLNGGGISQAWLHPWLNGETDRPAILWAASTPMEALYLTTVQLAIAKHRKSAYRDYKVTSDDKLLRISKQLPEWVTVVDEGAESMGTGATNDPVLRKLKANLEEIQRIGGNEGMNIVPSALRATQDMISGAVVKQSRVRIGMLMQDPEEISYLFGWQHRDATDPAELAGQGTGFLSSGETPRPFKAFFMRPSQVVRAAIVIANQRGELDEESRKVADGRFEIDLEDGRPPIVVENLYSDRLKRMRDAFAGNTVEAAEELADTVPAYTPTPAPTSRSLVDPADWPDLTAATQSTGHLDLSDPANWPDLSAPAQPARQAVGVLTAAPVQAVPVLLRQALAAFDAADDDRMHSETLAQSLGIGDPLKLAALFRPLEVTTLPNQFIRNKQNRRGYARDDIQNAANRIACGEIEVPAEVAEWPAA